MTVAAPAAGTISNAIVLGAGFLTDRAPEGVILHRMVFDYRPNGVTAANAQNPVRFSLQVSIQDVDDAGNILTGLFDPFTQPDLTEATGAQGGSRKQFLVCREFTTANLPANGVLVCGALVPGQLASFAGHTPTLELRPKRMIRPGQALVVQHNFVDAWVAASSFTYHMAIRTLFSHARRA